MWGGRKSSITCLFTNAAHSTIWHAVMYIGIVRLAVTRRTLNAKCLQQIPCLGYPRSFSRSSIIIANWNSETSPWFRCTSYSVCASYFTKERRFTTRILAFDGMMTHSKLLSFICKIATPCSINFDIYSWSRRGP